MYYRYTGNFKAITKGAYRWKPEEKREYQFNTIKTLAQFIRRLKGKNETLLCRQILENERWQTFIVDGTKIISEDTLKRYNNQLKVFSVEVEKPKPKKAAKKTKSLK